jgi:hypothetical protein
LDERARIDPDVVVSAVMMKETSVRSQVLFEEASIHRRGSA